MPSKVKKPPTIHAFDRISEWSVISKAMVKSLYINPDWGIIFNPGMSLDIEHDGNGKFVGVGMYDPKLNVCYYWTEPWQSKLVPEFIAHNGICDLYWLKQWGFQVNESNLVYDTMLMAHVIDSSRRNYGLKNLCKQDLGAEWPDYLDIVGKKKEKTLLDFPVEQVAEYNAADCYWTYKLYEHQLKRISIL